MSQGTGSYEVLNSTLSVNQYTATGLEAGLTYNFRVESYNAFGYSQLSSPKSILCATKPSKLSVAPRTSVTNEMVSIDWDPPTTNGLPIIAYSIYIRTGDQLTYISNNSVCNGINNNVIA